MKKKLTFLLAALFMCMQAVLAQDTWPTITGVVVTAAHPIYIGGSFLIL